jgi:hypothetical protein
MTDVASAALRLRMTNVAAASLRLRDDNGLTTTTGSR